MSNPSRYDPFSIEPVSDLFQGLFRPLRGLAGIDEPDIASMKLDVLENDAAYTVKAEMPGVEKSAIDVRIEGRTVSISAKVDRSEEQKEGDRVIRRERYTGTFSRSFTLAMEVDDAAAAAQYQDGVLTLTLPKKTSAEQKRIPIG